MLQDQEVKDIIDKLVVFKNKGKNRKINEPKFGAQWIKKDNQIDSSVQLDQDISSLERPQKVQETEDDCLFKLLFYIINN